VGDSASPEISKRLGVQAVAGAKGKLKEEERKLTRGNGEILDAASVSREEGIPLEVGSCGLS